MLPQASAGANDLIGLFASKGFSVVDLVAFIGAHTTAKQRVTDPSRAGAAMDSTVGIWDNRFYTETLNGQAPFTLQSDKGLSQNLVSTISFRSFALSQTVWNIAFVPAMQKLSMIGVSGKLVDCTSALPGGSRKRDLKKSPMFDRLGW